MRPFAVFAAALAAVFSLAAADGAAAQNSRRAPARPAAQAATPAPAPAPAQVGLTPGQVRDWLVSLGGEIDGIERDGGVVWVVVRDGGLNWLVFFYNCQNDVCADVQFVSSFFSPTTTPELVNAWNRDQRFLKAYTDPRADGAGLDAVATFDVILNEGGVQQLVDPLSVWLEQLDRFATHIGYTAAAQAANP